jgi:hypothetical protein
LTKSFSLFQNTNSAMGIEMREEEKKRERG